MFSNDIEAWFLVREQIGLDLSEIQVTPWFKCGQEKSSIRIGRVDVNSRF